MTVALAIVLQRCAIHAGASPNTFCRAVQELCKCLAPVVKGGDLFNMEVEILGEARKGLVALSSRNALSPMPGVKETINTPSPNPPPASKPEEAESPEELALVPRRQPLPPPGFAPLGMDDSEILPLEDAYRPVASPIGSMLDLTALVLLQMTISHRQAIGEVHYFFQAQSITRTFLSSASS